MLPLGQLRSITVSTGSSQLTKVPATVTQMTSPLNINWLLQHGSRTVISIPPEEDPVTGDRTCPQLLNSSSPRVLVLTKPHSAAVQDNLQLPCTKLVTRVGESFLLEGKCLVPLRLAGTELCSGISLKMFPGVLGEHLHLHHHTPPCSKTAASFLWCKWEIMLQWFCKTSLPMQYF